MPIEESIAVVASRVSRRFSVDSRSTPQNLVRGTSARSEVSTVDAPPELRIAYVLGSVHGAASIIWVPGGALPPSPKTRCTASVLIDLCFEVAGTESPNLAIAPAELPGMNAGLQVWEYRSDTRSAG